METNTRQFDAERATKAGILVLDKPRGITSRAVVDRVIRVFPGVKVGHAGTLDPLASGIMIVCTGTATRLVNELQEPTKSYRTTICLGARSDTLDADGQIVPETNPRTPDAAELERALVTLTGEISQQPPDYSALKVKGRRAYELARAGRDVALAPRLVRIDRIALLSYNWPRELEIDCGSGTYIRSIARDLGEAVLCGGYVETLVRTRIGPFTLDDALDADRLSADAVNSHHRPAIDALAGWTRRVLAQKQLTDITHGRRLPAADLDPPLPAPGRIALLDPAGVLVAVAAVDPEGAWVYPQKVLA